MPSAQWNNVFADPIRRRHQHLDDGGGEGGQLAAVAEEVKRAMAFGEILKKCNYEASCRVSLAMAPDFLRAYSLWAH